MQAIELAGGTAGPKTRPPASRTSPSPLKARFSLVTDSAGRNPR
jgi:hypothetical protein